MKNKVYYFAQTRARLEHGEIILYGNNVVNVSLYFIGLVFLWKHYNSFENKNFKEPKKKSKKNMIKYYSDISENRSSQKFFGWILFVYIVWGFFAVSNGDGGCVPNSGWFGFC